MRRMMNGSVLLALVLALAGGGAAYVALAGSQVEASADRETVVVAARDIAVGTRITAADLREERVAAGQTVFASAAASPGQVTGQYALLPMVAGEPVLLQKVATDPPGSGLAGLIPPGRIAISVAVNDVIRTGGFIAPGDRVDVFGVVTREATDIADIVIRDVPVLAVSSSLVGDDRVEARSNDNPRSLYTTVTLAVTVEEARRLVQVDELGSLRLALRPRTASD
jgi:pilus assembly protein CpaB